jgi:hypothetical protein
MPTILDLFKQANANGEVTMWNGGAENKGLGGKIMDFVKAEINPKGPRVLFYKKLVTPPLIYGTETPRISLKGTVDPPRTLALTKARYNDDPTKKAPISLASLMGGSANRPSDTIFPDKEKPPVSRYSTPSSTGDWNALKYAVEAGTDYIISKAPMGPNALSGVLKGDLNQMAGKAVGAGIGAAKKAIGKAVQKAVTSKRRKNQAKPTEAKDKTNKAGTLYNNKAKNSQYFTNYDSQKSSVGLVERKDRYKSLDDVNTQLTSTPYFKDETDLNKLTDTAKIGTPYVKIKPYGKPYLIAFPAIVSGISESITPEWNSFKYVGSPYNTYRYGGVERTLSFEFKLYYLNELTKQNMIGKLNSLRELAFPYNEINPIKYSDKEVALTHSPNLIELSITGLYQNIFGFVTQLEISVDDATSWAGDINMASSNLFGNELYPSVINVSFGMTIIENHQIDTGVRTQIMRYDFDGKGRNTVSMIWDLEEQKLKAEKETKRLMEEAQKVFHYEVEEEPVEENPDAIEPSTFEYQKGTPANTF